MQKKALIIMALVVCLMFPPFAGVVAAEEPQTESVSLDLGVSDNLFFALRQMERKRMKVNRVSNPQEARCFLVEEEAFIAQKAISEYFDGKALTTEGKKNWEDFPLAGAAYRYGERYKMSPSESAWAFVWDSFVTAMRIKTVCLMGT